MKLKKLLLLVFFFVGCASAQAEWFLRGTHNAWGATQMISAGAGTNTMQLNDVVFAAAGNIKFDRFGDWKESYGVGGLGGGNIAVGAGTWNIKFFTDSKNWSITPATVVDAKYHVRGTFNAFAEGTLMARIGVTNMYESCVNFRGGDAAGGPRFKIDPNGGWGDAIPATDFAVSTGWVKIFFDSTAKTITVSQNLGVDCGGGDPTPPLKLHVRGTFNAWAEGTLMARIDSTDIYESCIEFKSGDAAGGPRFKMDPNGGWGDAIPVADFVVAVGWVKINFDSLTKTLTVRQNLGVNCGGGDPTPPLKLHVRGTFNAWAEGTLMARVDATDVYQSCINFTAGDAAGGPRFKIDLNGGWGDAIPAADFGVAIGWVKISFNSISKVITTQERQPALCI